MADILQAAKWMQEGKRVKRPEFGFSVTGEGEDETGFGPSLSAHFPTAEYVAELTLPDLLANDWELAQ